MHCISGQNLSANKAKKAKKKNPKNAFSFYLDEVFKELRNQGRGVESKTQAVPAASEKWKKMTAAEKEPYEKKAKEWKMEKKAQIRPGRLDCTGKLIDNRVDMDDLHEKRRKERRRIARSSWPNDNGVCDEHFYIISFQSLFELPDEEGFHPCEVACVDYTINGGILREWHKFIDPGPVKLGLASEVKFFREQTHKIPEKGFESASNQYDQIWRELLQFLKPDRSSTSYPPLYTRMSELHKTEFCLQWMSSMARIANRLHDVYELEDIAAELFEHAGLDRPSLSIIEAGCASSMYDYETNTKCEYHDELECIYCALLVVKKCCYWMSDALCQVYCVEITDKHLPVRQPPTYVVTSPETLVIDERPRRKAGPRVNPFTKESGYRPIAQVSTGSRAAPPYASRDIRYRSQFEVVPHPREEDLDDDSEDTSATETAGEPDSELSGTETQSLVFGAKAWPPIERNRRPITQPSFAAKQGAVLAANFQRNIKLTDQSLKAADADKNGELGDVAGRKHPVNTLGSTREGFSFSDAVKNHEESDTASLQSLKMKAFGLGRGRGRFL